MGDSNCSESALLSVVCCSSLFDPESVTYLFPRLFLRWTEVIHKDSGNGDSKEPEIPNVLQRSR